MTGRWSIRCASWLALSLLSSVSSGCDTREISLALDFEPDALALDARAMEVHVVASCTGVSHDRTPDAAIRSVTFRRGDLVGSLGGGLPERFGVLALARGSDCMIVATGCTSASRSDTEVRVVLTARSGAACEASRCDDGLCVASSVDAGEGLPDATRDAPSIDAARTPEPTCDCADDDTDGVVDEGCADTVRYQAVLDGPGIDALRGAAVGGDGRLWVNGWLSADTSYGACASLAGVPPGSPIDGPSHLLALDLADATCLAHFERPLGHASSFATPWPAADGAWLFTEEGLQRFTTRAETALSVSPPPDFYAGVVIAAPDDPRDLLVSYRATPSGATMAVLDGAMTAHTLPHLVGHLTPAGADWLINVTTPAIVGRIDATRWSMLTVDGSGQSMLEIRDVSTPSNILSSSPVPITLVDGSEHAGVASAGVSWVAVREPSNAVWLVAHRPGSEPVLRALPSAAPSSPLFSIAALPGDGIVLGAGAMPGGVLEGASVAGGYVARARLVGTEIVIDRVRRIGQGTTGVGTSADGTVYVVSHATMGDPRCTPTPSTLETDADGARLITALTGF